MLPKSQHCHYSRKLASQQCQLSCYLLTRPKRKPRSYHCFGSGQYCYWCSISSLGSFPESDQPYSQKECKVSKFLKLVGLQSFAKLNHSRFEHPISPKVNHVFTESHQIGSSGLHLLNSSSLDRFTEAVEILRPFSLWEQAVEEIHSFAAERTLLSFSTIRVGLEMSANRLVERRSLEVAESALFELEKKFHIIPTWVYQLTQNAHIFWL